MAKHHCDGCGKERSDVRSCGQDFNGNPDAPDLCFICWWESVRGLVYNQKFSRYVLRCDETDEKEFPDPIDNS